MKYYPICPRMTCLRVGTIARYHTQDTGFYCTQCGASFTQLSVFEHKRIAKLVWKRLSQLRAAIGDPISPSPFSLRQAHAHTTLILEYIRTHPPLDELP